LAIPCNDTVCLRNTILPLNDGLVKLGSPMIAYPVGYHSCHRCCCDWNF